MRIISKEEVFEHRESILNGTIFIYPTDTIYGIGCNALIKESVDKIRQIKERGNIPFSIIAPSKEWIHQNCVIDEQAKKWIEKLPGPYTLILESKNKHISENISPGLSTIGVRIPKHWISEFVHELGVPIVTTSVNKHQKAHMTSLEDLDPTIKKSVDLIIYEGEIKGKASTIIDLTNNGKIVER